MRHVAVPATLTVEALASWIVDNKAEQINHAEKVPLDDEAIRELEHKSSAASRKMDELLEVKKQFELFLKKGTPTERLGDHDLGEPKHLPQTITIVPTKGLDALKANREYADAQLRNGYREDITPYYLIPYIEERKMVAVDIEGRENENYSRPMTEFELEDHSKPVLEAIADEGKKSKKKKKDEGEESFV